MSKQNSSSNLRPRAGLPGRLAGTWIWPLLLMAAGTGMSLCVARAQPLPDRRPLVGHLTGDNGRPIGGAVVVTRRQDELGPAVYWGGRTVSDAHGDFVFPDAEEGEYFVDAEADGYASLQNCPYRLDADSQRLDLVLNKLCSLTVKIETADGSTFAKGDVVLRLRGADGAAQAARYYPTHTDADGQVTFADLIPSHYQIHGIAPGHGYVEASGIDVSSAPHRAPTELRLQSGGSLRVTASEGVGDARRPFGGAFISVVPVVAAGGPPSDEEVALYAFSNDRSALVTRDRDGVARLDDIMPGTYRLSLYAFGPGLCTPQILQIRANETTQAVFDLKPAPGETHLTVTLLTPAGAPAADLDWGVLPAVPLSGAADMPPMPPMPPNAPQGIASQIMGGPVRRVHSDAAGRFTLFPMMPGKWHISVYQPPAQEDAASDLVLFSGDVVVGADGGAMTITVKPQGKK